MALMLLHPAHRTNNLLCGQSPKLLPIAWACRCLWLWFIAMQARPLLYLFALCSIKRSRKGIGR